MFNKLRHLSVIFILDITSWDILFKFSCSKNLSIHKCPLWRVEVDGEFAKISWNIREISVFITNFDLNSVILSTVIGWNMCSSLCVTVCFWEITVSYNKLRLLLSQLLPAEVYARYSKYPYVIINGKEKKRRYEDR